MSSLSNFFKRAPLAPGGQSYEKPTSQQDHASANINEWPTSPQTVKRDKLWNLCDIAVDVLLACCCLAFLVFALLVRGYDGARVEEHEALTEGMRKATTYGPTVLPILFATVVGRASKACLAWRLEAGEKLGNLDVLASSTTFASAMLAQISLRSVSVIGCLLAAVWTLSPVGGQASLRIMTIGKMPVANTASFDYLSMNNSYADWHSASGGGELAPTATGLYLASLTAPQRMKDSPTDLWDNVKIPMLEEIPAWKESVSAADTWYEVPQHNVSYASLVGVPVSVLESDAETAIFNLETSYWRLDCPIVQRGPACDVLDADSLPADEVPQSCTTPLPKAFETLDESCHRADWYGMYQQSSSLYSNSSCYEGVGSECGSSPVHTPVRHLIYSGWSSYVTANVSDQQFSAHCIITTSHIEAEVQCQGRACTVPRIRRSQLPHPPSGWTSLDDAQCSNFLFFTSWFLSIVDAGRSTTGSLPQAYLVSPSDPSLVVHKRVNATHPGDLSPPLFAQRLVQLFNTWWMVSIGREVVSSGVEIGRSRLDTYGEPLRVPTTDGTLSHQVDTIKCIDTWFVTLVTVSAVLIAASVVPLILRFCTHAPAFSLLVSTMLKDNPYFEAPNTGSTLESSDRSRLLKLRRVRFGDVAPSDDIGYLAVGSLSDDDDGVGKVGIVEPDRLYK